MSLILLALGVYILVRFTLRGIDRRHLGKPMRKRFLGPLGLVAGFVDATGGGGWGPVGTPAILASGRMEPRKVIGSIDTVGVPRRRSPPASASCSRSARRASTSPGSPPCCSAA